MFASVVLLASSAEGLPSEGLSIFRQRFNPV
jgi:hypothetical protein